ncbi:hypothetical protein OG618_18255 [Kitasatospora sp. NBC_01246]|uniref:hypothetical protein n=1 Tax=Kitasatospora sp. NBC_01246 TaxID=2903570 RepID=UPI002E3027DB|nr:hypothetical protein [Kitasatospora sp. NBC_01246]
MNVTLPLVVVLGAGVWTAIKLLGIRLWVAALIALFGFYLAGTFLAPVIEETTRTGVTAVNPK